MLHTRIRFATVLALFAIVSCSESMTPEGPTAVDAAVVASPPEAAKSVVDLTNVERTRAGLTALRSSSRLMQAAQIQADQMARIGRLDHVLPEATYPRPEDRLAAAGYGWQAYAENVAYNQRTASEAVDAWMHSSGHRANMMSPSLTEIGTGYARDASGRPYWVQVFGRPIS